MIIRCSQCGTRYHFPDEKIKPDGTKVRCVRCRNVFVAKPTESVSPFEEIFEPRGPAEESAVAEKTVPSKEVVSGGLFQGVPGSGNGAHEEKPTPVQEEPTTAEAEGEPVTASLEAGEQAEEAEESAFFDDLGSADETEKEFIVEAVEKEQPSADEQAPVEPPPSHLSDDDVFIRESPVDIASPEPTKGGRSVVGRIFMLLFFLVVILCSAIAGYLFWRGEPFEVASLMKIIQQPVVQAPKPGGKIRLQGVKSFYVFNREAGQLFVLSGTAVNEFAEARSNISVKGILYDGKGGKLRQQTVFCGNPFEKEALADMPYKTVEENMHNQFGTTFSNLNIAPGKEIPFSIVFRNLPENLAEFSVEVVGSKSVGNKK